MLCCGVVSCKGNVEFECKCWYLMPNSLSAQLEGGGRIKKLPPLRWLEKSANFLITGWDTSKSLSRLCDSSQRSGERFLTAQMVTKHNAEPRCEEGSFIMKLGNISSSYKTDASSNVWNKTGSWAEDEHLTTAPFWIFFIMIIFFKLTSFLKLQRKFVLFQPP